MACNVRLSCPTLRLSDLPAQATDPRSHAAHETKGRAFERGRDGERYILSGETLSPRQFLKRVARNSGRTAPAPLPPRMANAGAMIATALAAPFGARPRLSRDEARFAATGFRVDGQHAVHELGLEYTPMFRYLPGLVRSYQSAERRFAS